QFQLKFSNTGASMDKAIDVSSKALLVPRGDYARKLVGQGIVLDTIVSPLHLATGEETIVDVTATLPNVPEGEYYLGATTNTRYSAQVDNSGDDFFPIPPEEEDGEVI